MTNAGQTAAISVLALLGCAAASARRGSTTSAGGGSAGGAPPAAPVEVARAPLGALTVSKWRLANGLEVVLLPDPRATSVSYMTWFRVGSRNEDAKAGETGLAHLFENLMFTQTKSSEANAFDSKMDAVGGSNNAMTYYDFTAYVDDIPPTEMRLATTLEADRMVNLDLRKKQVETERDVVAEERLASVEDSVDGILDELMYGQAFKTHPYRWPVIGSMKDIKAMTQERAVAFYRKYYAPNNAVLVIAGRLDEAATLAVVAEAYGAIPPSKSLPLDGAKPERAPGSEVRTVISRPVPADRLVIGFPAPALGAPDRAAYEVLNELLAGGPSSRLNRALVVERQWASSVHGDIAPTRDPGLYAIWVQMTKGHSAEEAERLVVETAADLAAHPVAAAELGKAAARMEAQFWQQLGSSHGRAETLGAFEIAAGDFRALLARGGEYARVSASDVQKAAADYLGTGARSVVIARPGAETKPAGPVARQKP
ncbi:MAG TPA: pitrilysin family protein [Polyangia bacterium]|nr:pitrilysin family protein [Polyangia bacterium]